MAQSGGVGPKINTPISSFRHSPFIKSHRNAQTGLTDLEIAKIVTQDGRINALGARIPLASGFNIKLFNSLVTSRHDREIVQYLTYGWPLNRECAPVAKTYMNHPSANRYPQQIENYISSEMARNTLLGPFITSPFQEQITGISPMSTRPKKGNSTKRRVLVDLSWPPEGASVNSAIPKETFMNALVKLRFPTIDMLCKRASEVGPRAVGWKRDMEAAFRQLILCPSAWSYLAISWHHLMWFNKAAVMGCRSSPYACQETTSVVRHIMQDLSYTVFNYIDDFMSIDLFTRAWKSFKTLENLMRDLGVQEAPDKAVAPVHIIEFLGILFDLLRMIILLPEDKMNQIKHLLKVWQRMDKCTKKQLQSLTGKLQFAASCIRAGRVFVTRLYNCIAIMEDNVNYKIPTEVRKDLKWWYDYMDQYNGASIMWLVHKETAGEVMATDASMKGIGAICGKFFFHKEIPQWWCAHYAKNIAHYEMLAIVVATKAWKSQIKGLKFVIACDNSGIEAIINRGRSKDKLLQSMLRELTYTLATNDAEIVIQHITSKSNEGPDALSRWSLGTHHHHRFEKIKGLDWLETEITDEMLLINENW